MIVKDLIKHKTKTRIYITKYYLSGFKKLTKWKARNK